MRLGWTLSIAGHAALLLALLFAGVFSRDVVPDLRVSEVSVISEAEFAALTPPGAAPDTTTETPRIAAPEAGEAPRAPAPDAAPDTAEAPPVETPDAASEPQVAPPPLIPDAVVEDDAPVIDTPATDVEGSAVIAEGMPEPAPRVAPVPQVAPPPEAERAPERVPDRAPERDEDPLPEPPPDEAPAAPPEASDRVVTEAEERPELAPASTMRPRTRPARPLRRAEAETPPEPQPQPQPQPQAEPQTPSTDDAVLAALSEPDSAADSAAPAGPPLTGGEKDAFRIAVGDCWVVDPGARSAGVVVVVGFSLSRDGRVEGDVRRIAASGGDPNTQRAAFDAARRAILRCGRNGYALPPEKYAQWRDVEITFNPEGMQFR